MLQNILFVVLIVFLIVLIIIGIKLIFILDEVSQSLEDVNKKLRSLDGVFDMIEKTTDFFDDVKYKTSVKVAKFVNKFRKRKEEDYE